MSYGRAIGKAPAPTHNAFQKNKGLGSFGTKSTVLGKASGAVGGGGTTHFPAPQDSTNQGSIPAAREALTGLSLDHHR